MRETQPVLSNPLLGPDGRKPWAGCATTAFRLGRGGAVHRL